MSVVNVYTDEIKAVMSLSCIEKPKESDMFFFSLDCTSYYTKSDKFRQMILKIMKSSYTDNFKSNVL